MTTWPNQSAAANRRPAGQSDGSGNLAATVAADRAFPAAVAELGSFGGSMRVSTAISIILVTAFTGCRSPVPPETRSISLSWPPHVEVVCELRAYRVGERSYDEREFEALKNASERDLRWEVSGFLWEIISPARFAGKALSSHFDGPLASGDPFMAFTFRKRYCMKVSESAIGDDRYSLCY